MVASPISNGAKRTIVVDQIETCKQMAYNGIGYAILPAITLNGPDKNMFQIPLLDEKGMPIKRDTWLLGYDSAFELRQVQAFWMLSVNSMRIMGILAECSRL